MSKKWTLLFFLSACAFSLNAQASLTGTLTCSKTGEPVMFANVILMEGDELKWGAQTGFEGEFKMIPLEAGHYNLIATYVGYDTLRISDVIVKENEETVLVLKMELPEIPEIAPIEISEHVLRDTTLLLRPAWAGNSGYHLMHFQVSELNPVVLNSYGNGKYEIDCYEKLNWVRLTDVDGNVFRHWIRLKAGKTKVDFGDLKTGGYYLKSGKGSKEEVKANFWIP